MLTLPIAGGIVLGHVALAFITAIGAKLMDKLDPWWWAR